MGKPLTLTLMHNWSESERVSMALIIVQRNSHSQHIFITHRQSRSMDQCVMRVYTHIYTHTNFLTQVIYSALKKSM